MTKYRVVAKVVFIRDGTSFNNVETQVLEQLDDKLGQDDNFVGRWVTKMYLGGPEPEDWR